MRISALADGTGYREYDEDSATHLLFIHRARRMGLSCDQIADLLPVWGGANCEAAHDRVGRLIDEKQAEIAERIGELEAFARQLNDVRARLEASPPSRVSDGPHLLHALRRPSAGAAGAGDARREPASTLGPAAGLWHADRHRRVRLQVR